MGRWWRRKRGWQRWLCNSVHDELRHRQVACLVDLPQRHVSLVAVRGPSRRRHCGRRPLHAAPYKIRLRLRACSVTGLATIDGGGRVCVTDRGAHPDFKPSEKLLLLLVAAVVDEHIADGCGRGHADGEPVASATVGCADGSEAAVDGKRGGVGAEGATLRRVAQGHRRIRKVEWRCGWRRDSWRRPRRCGRG